MALALTDTLITSDATSHVACACIGGRPDEGWQVSWLPGRIVDRNAAIIAMTLADLVSQGEGIGLSDDPRWPAVDDLAARVGRSGSDAVERGSEPASDTAGGHPAGGARPAGAILCVHADQDGRLAHWRRPREKCEAGQ